MKKKNIIIITTIVIAVLLLIIGVLLINRQTEKDKENESEKIEETTTQNDEAPYFKASRLKMQVGDEEFKFPDRLKNIMYAIKLDEKRNLNDKVEDYDSIDGVLNDKSLINVHLTVEKTNESNPIALKECYVKTMVIECEDRQEAADLILPNNITLASTFAT